MSEKHHIELAPQWAIDEMKNLRADNARLREDLTAANLEVACLVGAVRDAKQGRQNIYQAMCEAERDFRAAIREARTQRDAAREELAMSKNHIQSLMWRMADEMVRHEKELATLQEWRDRVVREAPGLCATFYRDGYFDGELQHDAYWDKTRAYGDLQALLAPPEPKQEMPAQAEVDPPSYYIREEMEKREWDFVALLDATGTNRETDEAVLSVCCDNAPITPEVAAALGRAFGTGPEVWINLNSMWQASVAQAEREGQK